MSKYLKQFDTYTDYETFVDSAEFEEPNVSYVAEQKKFYYTPIPEKWVVPDGMCFGNSNGDLDLTWMDVSKVKNMGGFLGSSYYASEENYLNSINISNWNTSNATDMSGFFKKQENLTSLDVTNFDTSNVTSMDDMFSDCYALTSLDVTNFDTSNVTSMDGMFSSCNKLASLDVSKFDTSNVTDMSSMFSSCNNLTSLDLSNFDTSKVTSMSYMFRNCNNLTSLDVSNFDTSKVTSMSDMFEHCSGLTSLDLSNFDTSKVTSMSYMFNDCNKLASLIGSHTLEEVEIGVVVAFNRLKVSLDLSSTNLDRASLLAVIKGLTTVTSTTTLTLGSTLLAKLTDEDKKIATDKGWTLV